MDHQERERERERERELASVVEQWWYQQWWCYMRLVGGDGGNTGG